MKSLKPNDLIKEIDDNFNLNKHQNTLSFGTLRDNIKYHQQKIDPIKNTHFNHNQLNYLKNQQDLTQALKRVKIQIQKHHQIDIESSPSKNTNLYRSSPKFKTHPDENTFLPQAYKDDQRLQKDIHHMKKNLNNNISFGQMEIQLAKINQKYTSIIQQLQTELQKEKQKNTQITSQLFNLRYLNTTENHKKIQKESEKLFSMLLDSPLVKQFENQNKEILSCIEEVSGEYQSVDLTKSQNQNQQSLIFYKTQLKNVKNQHEVSLKKLIDDHTKAITAIKNQLANKNIIISNLENQIKYYQYICKNYNQNNSLEKKSSLLNQQYQNNHKNDQTQSQNNFEIDDQDDIVLSQLNQHQRSKTHCFNSVRQISPIFGVQPNKNMVTQSKYINLRKKFKSLKVFVQTLKEQINILKLANQKSSVQKDILYLQQFADIQNNYQKQIHEIYENHRKQIKILIEQQSMSKQGKTEFQSICKTFQQHIQQLNIQIINRDKLKQQQISLLKKYYQSQIKNISHKYRLNLDVNHSKDQNLQIIQIHDQKRKDNLQNNKMMQQIAENYQLMDRVQKLQQQNRTLSQKIMRLQKQDKSAETSQINTQLKQAKKKLQNGLVEKYQQILKLEQILETKQIQFQQESNRLQKRIAKLIAQHENRLATQIAIKNQEIQTIQSNYQKLIQQKQLILRNQMEKKNQQIGKLTLVLTDKENLIKKFMMKQESDGRKQKDNKPNTKAKLQSTFNQSIQSKIKNMKKIPTKIDVDCIKTLEQAYKPGNSYIQQQETCEFFKLDPIVNKQKKLDQKSQQRSFLSQNKQIQSQGYSITSQQQQMFPKFMFEMNNQKMKNSQFKNKTSNVSETSGISASSYQSTNKTSESERLMKKGNKIGGVVVKENQKGCNSNIKVHLSHR